MFWVYPANLEEQRQLQREFVLQDGYFAVPSKQASSLGSLLSAILYQFFHQRVPLIAEKMKQLVCSLLNSSLSLPAFRELLQLLKEEEQKMQTYQSHLLDMNRAFNDNQLENWELQGQQQDQDALFEAAVLGVRRPASLHILDLPTTLLEIPAPEQDKEEEEMWTELAARDCETIQGMGTSRLEDLFTLDLNFEQRKTPRKEDNTHAQTSRSMSSYKKRRSTIVANNRELDPIVAQEVQHDLTREINLGIGTASPPSSWNYHKKIRSAIINYKMRPRRK